VDDLRFHRRVRYEGKANWKIAIENVPLPHPLPGHEAERQSRERLLTSTEELVQRFQGLVRERIEPAL